MTPAVDVRDLWFSYPDGTEALRGVKFTVADGECVGVIGHNGAGKSTLLLHLNGLLPEIHGRPPNVYIFGKPVSKQTLNEIHRTVGLLFQDPNDQLFCPTVFEDVSFGPRQLGVSEDELRGIVGKALSQVNMTDCENRSPHHLSGGEKQRICLAGVLACGPNILVLDEPTRDLDPRGKRDLKNILKNINATKIIASNDLELVVELCSRAILLDRGEVVAEGLSAELLSDEDLMLAHGLEKPHSLRHRHPH